MIRLLNDKDCNQASELIESLGETYNRNDFSEQGFQKFRSTVLYDGMKKNMAEGFQYWGMFESVELLGLIAVKPPTHLYNLFVHKDHHKKGIASRLWNHVVSQLQPEKMTVFSSTYALGLYQNLGFKPSGEKIENDEIICYPMLWELNP